MTVSEEAAHLHKVDLFAGIEREQRFLLALTSVEPLTYGAGEILFRQGEAADAAYVVIEGSAEILLEDAGGETRVTTIGKSGIIGETSLLCDVRRRATVRAAEPLKALRISKEAFERFLASSPHLSLTILRTVAMQYDQMLEIFSRSDRGGEGRVWDRADRSGRGPSPEHLA